MPYEMTGEETPPADTRWQDWYRTHGPQRPYAARTGLAAPVPAGAIEYAGGACLRLADLCPPRPNWREATGDTAMDLTIAEGVVQPLLFGALRGAE